MESYKKYFDKDWLTKKYAKEKSVSKIAKENGVAVTTISRWLSRFNIRRKKKYKVERSGPKNPYWNGGRYQDKLSRYILLYYPDHPFAKKKGYIFEHRLVMEKFLGRYLRKNEIVHHRNKVRSDNRIENLELVVLGDINGGDVMCPHCNKKFKLS